MALPVTVSRVQHRRGTQVEFDGLYPPGYIGTGLTVSERAAWPNSLASGEVGLCTDTRRVFIGGINGQYIELSAASTPTPTPTPTEPAPSVSLVLPPASVFTVIPALSYNPTGFFSFVYSVTDSIGPDWNTPGEEFSQNGVLQVTAISGTSPNAELTDVNTQINTTLSNISFIATYNIITSKIDISYIHNFTTSVRFSTSTIKWDQI